MSVATPGAPPMLPREQPGDASGRPGAVPRPVEPGRRNRRRRSLTGRPAPPHSEAVTRALAVLTGIGLLTVLIEVPGLSYPWAAAGAALLFAVIAVAGFGRIDRQEPRRRRMLAARNLVVPQQHG
jgi:hypothetical protein